MTALRGLWQVNLGDRHLATLSAPPSLDQFGRGPGLIFEPLVFGAAAGRSYGQVVAATVESGRSHQRPSADLLIAATAHANGLALYTRNPDDFAGLDDLIRVVGI